MPKGKIAYLFGSKEKNKEDEFISDIDSTLRVFEDDGGISYSILWDVPVSEGGSRLVSQSKCAEKEATPKVTDLTTDPSMSSVAEMVKEDREARNIGQKQNVFLSVMWTEKGKLLLLCYHFCFCIRIRYLSSLVYSFTYYTETIRYFKMYPETVFCDITSHSNNKKYHLLTFSCKSAVNKHVVFLKAWIPNQKRFSFRWVFKYAIESLGLDKYFQYTELFMKDGDPQQHNEIKGAMTEYLRNAADAACGWHIVHQGFQKNCPGKKSVGPEHEKKWEQFTDHVKSWIYSWMRPGYCESEEEYKVSKELLFRYIASESALDAAGGNAQHLTRVKEWVRKLVSSHDTLFLHYLRKSKRTFDTFVASGHE